MHSIEDVTLKSHDGSEVMVGNFGELLMGHKVDDVSVSFKYPFYNTSFDMKPAVITGDGVVSVSDSMLNVSSTIGTAQAETLESVRYRNGHTGFVDFTALFSGNGEGWVGGVDDDGFFLHRNAGVMTFGRRRGGIDTEINQSSWNGDIKPESIDWTKVNIFRIIFGYLGVADAILQVRFHGWKTLCIMETEGVLTTTTIKNPSFPFRVKTSGAMTIKVGSVNAGTINGADIFGARFFDFSGDVTLSGTNVSTVGHFRNKSTYKTVNNKVKAELLRYKFFVDAPASGTGTVEIKIRKNATISGVPTFADVDVDNSIMEYATNVTYNTGGKNIFTDWVGYSGTTGSASADSNGQSEQLASQFGLYLLPGETATITAQNVAGNTAVKVRILFNWLELF